MYAHPGKKLLFMGGEFGQFIEWNEWQGLDWHLLDYESHGKMREFVKNLNKFYRREPCLYELPLMVLSGLNMKTIRRASLHLSERVRKEIS